MKYEQKFVGRKRELEILQSCYRREGGELVLIAGRRRIGKTYLIQRFLSDLPQEQSVFFQATRQTKALELEAFGTAVRKAVEDFPQADRIKDWPDMLEFLTKMTTTRLVVVLDEFPYLCESTRGLVSIVQRWWDQGGRHSHIMLVLCGSAQTFMRDLTSYSGPLHQRFTSRMVLDQLSYDEAAEFTPHLSPEDLVRVYGIVGGTPVYLEQWNERASVRDNLVTLFGNPASLLVDSAQAVLGADLPDSTAAYRAAQAIALGKTGRNEIIQHAKVPDESVLSRLEDMRVVSRRVPITEYDEYDSSRAIYVLSDPYFRFYFRFIARERGTIDRGLGEELVDASILPELEGHFGFVFEEIARAYARRLIKQKELKGTDAGSWWSRSGHHQLDIVGAISDRPSFIGTVKWRASALDRTVLKNMEDHARALGVDKTIPWLLIGRGGVEGKILTEPHLRAVSIDDLYDRRGGERDDGNGTLEGNLIRSFGNDPSEVPIRIAPDKPSQMKDRVPKMDPEATSLAQVTDGATDAFLKSLRRTIGKKPVGQTIADGSKRMRSSSVWL